MPGGFSSKEFLAKIQSELLDKSKRTKLLLIPRKNSFQLQNFYISRFQEWNVKENNFTGKCSGTWKSESCIFGVGDLPMLIVRPELVVHKLYIDKHPASFFCLYHKIRQRALDFKNQKIFDASNYENLPQVQLSRDDETIVKKHFAIYSTFYYNVSKIYSPNSMVILLNTDKNIETKNINFQCFSKNETNTFSSDLQLRLAFADKDKSINCKWEVFIANCSTVLNPTFFGIESVNTPEIVEIDFELPVPEKYPVVMCFAPMVYESRWQQLIFATEMYHHFGVDLQVQYFNSAMKQIMEILKIYEKKRWIKIQEFAYFDFDRSIINDIGFNPMKEILSRNQHLALSDCVMKYRESSEFIIIADIDEIIFPKENNYFQEFSKWSKLYPTASAFSYLRSYAKIDTPNEFSKFSLSKTLESIRISKSFFMGKSILQTKNVETAWIHWPGLSRGKRKTIDPKLGRIYHIQTSAEKVRSVKNVLKLGEKENIKNLIPFNPLQKNEIQSINDTFVSTFSNIQNFKDNHIYADIIFECFKKHENWKVYDSCYTPFECKIPSNVKNFECEIVKRNFSMQTLGQNFVFYIPKLYYQWIKNEEKCQIFNNE